MSLLAVFFICFMTKYNINYHFIQTLLDYFGIIRKQSFQGLQTNRMRSLRIHIVKQHSLQTISIQVTTSLLLTHLVKVVHPSHLALQCRYPYDFLTQMLRNVQIYAFLTQTKRHHHEFIWQLYYMFGGPYTLPKHLQR